MTREESFVRMSMFNRFGLPPIAGRPDFPAGQLPERARFVWRVGDGGDPAAQVEDFLAEHGLPVRDLASELSSSASMSGSGGSAGASLFVSAAAGTYLSGLSGAAVGPPSPAPAVPDVVAVVWDPPGRWVPATPSAADRIQPAGAQPADARSADARSADARSADARSAEHWQVGPWQASWDPAAHAAAVSAVRAAIARGDVYQVNVVGHTAAPYLGDPVPALHRVASLPGARYAGLLSGAGWAVACASPETLVEVSAGRVVTRPIKGTRPATETGRAELLASTKERAEHVMIVDLERNDLARLARIGSVRVDELFAVRRWCDLWQAESVVSAALAGQVGLAQLLRSVCPGGSVTGAPKRAALEVIAATEPVGRGPSMGALGWIGPDRLDLGLTIRTVAADADRVHVWAGGGITWDSEPAAEVAEAAAKAAPLIQAVEGGPAAAGTPPPRHEPPGQAPPGQAPPGPVRGRR